MTTTSLTPEQLEQLATEHATLADTIATAQERQKEIKAILAGLGNGKHTAGPFTVQITRPMRFDAKAAEAAYPFEGNEHFYSTSLDRKKLEHALPPATIDMFKKPGSATVTVK